MALSIYPAVCADLVGRIEIELLTSGSYNLLFCNDKSLKVKVVISLNRKFVGSIETVICHCE
jgi:hypothetical protein